MNVPSQSYAGIVTVSHDLTHNKACMRNLSFTAGFCKTVGYIVDITVMIAGHWHATACKRRTHWTALALLSHQQFSSNSTLHVPTVSDNIAMQSPRSDGEIFLAEDQSIAVLTM